MEENGVDDIEETCGMPLLLEGRENEDLAEAERVGGRSEGVREDVEEAVADENGMAFRRGEQGEKQPAVVGVRIDDDFACAVDEPIAERLHVVEESDGVGRRKSRPG